MKNLLLLMAVSCAMFISCEKESISSQENNEITLETRGAEKFDHSGNENFPHTVTNGCNGEKVVLDGIVNWHYWGTTTPSGKVHVNYHQNFANIIGTGQTTGTKYNCVGVINEAVHNTVGETYTLTINQNLISTGTAPSFLIKLDQHYTVDANGNVHAEKDNFRTTCK